MSSPVDGRRFVPPVDGRRWTVGRAQPVDGKRLTVGSLLPGFAVMLVWLSAAPALAQSTDTVLTLGGARTILQRQNPEYRSALASADAVGEQVWSAWGAWLPSATLQLNFSRNEFTTRTFVDPTGVPQTADPAITDTRQSASQALLFRWSLFDGGSRLFDLGSSRARARAADLGAVSTLVRLESQLEVQYWEALKQQEQARLARQLLAARRRDVEITQARFRIAAVAQTDVLQAEVQVGQNEVAVLVADQQAEAARRELSAALGIGEELSYQLRDTAVVFDPTALTLDELVSRARRSSPELARLDAEVDAAGKSLWSARGTWLPRIDLSLNLSRSEELPETAGLFAFNLDNTSTSFGVSLSWPLFNGFEKKWRTGQESARLQEARHNRQAGLLETDKEIRNQYDALVAAYQTYQIRRRLVDLAREAVRLATERYRIGATSYLELQQAISQLTEAERGLIDARYSFMQTLARLEGVLGQRLPRPK